MDPGGTFPYFTEAIFRVFFHFFWSFSNIFCLINFQFSRFYFLSNKSEREGEKVEQIRVPDRWSSENSFFLWLKYVVFHCFHSLATVAWKMLMACTRRRSKRKRRSSSACYRQQFRHTLSSDMQHIRCRKWDTANPFSILNVIQDRQRWCWCRQIYEAKSVVLGEGDVAVAEIVSKSGENESKINVSFIHHLSRFIMITRTSRNVEENWDQRKLNSGSVCKSLYNLDWLIDSIAQYTHSSYRQ